MVLIYVVVKNKTIVHIVLIFLLYLPRIFGAKGYNIDFKITEEGRNHMLLQNEFALFVQVQEIEKFVMG